MSNSRIGIGNRSTSRAAMILRCNLHQFWGRRAIASRFEQFYSQRPLCSGRNVDKSASGGSVLDVPDVQAQEMRRSAVQSFLRSFSIFRSEASADDIAFQSAAIRLYTQCANVDFIAFINKFKLPDTFGSWVKITSLHAWLVLLRTKREADGQDRYNAVREEIVDALWRDIRQRLDAISRRDQYLTRRTIRDELGRCYSYLACSMMELDEGIMREDTVLAGSLWRLFYKDDRANDIAALNDLVRYVRLQVYKMNQRTVTDILSKGVQNWDCSV